MDTPKVSVLMPTFNRESFITDAVRSVLAQDYGNTELVIVDDGSTDRTAEILVEQFSDYMTGVPVDGKTICYYPSEHQGISGARNLALDKATGAYIAFLDSDDRFHPNKLSLQMEYLQAHPEASIVFCGFENVEDFWKTSAAAHLRRNRQSSWRIRITRCTSRSPAQKGSCSTASVVSTSLLPPGRTMSGYVGSNCAVSICLTRFPRCCTITGSTMTISR